MDRRYLYGFLLFYLFISVIVVIDVCFVAKNGKREPEEEPLKFWQSSIIYQIYPKSFYDVNPDGIGDIKGITAKADYLQQLGVGIVWLSPIYESPQADSGYDISNYTAINPTFGTMDDFDQMLKALHDRGIKLVMDFVPNHSSDQHEWFKRSAQRDDKYTDYYVWDDGKLDDNGTQVPPNNWNSEFRGSAWEWHEGRKQFYYHEFLKEQPDLNYRSQNVRDEMEAVLRFWLDKGVDGFRVDALKFLVEVDDTSLDEPENPDAETDDPDDPTYLLHNLTTQQPETLQVLREWRLLMDQYHNRVLMVEVYDEDVMQVVKYYGNDSVPLADFPFNFFLIDNLHNRTEVTGHSLKKTVDLWLDNMPEGKWPNWVLSNHDNSRVGSRLGTDLEDALNMFTLLLPGTPVTYYGEEIGMEDTWISWNDTQDNLGCQWGQEGYEEYSRDPERTPMQWDNSTFCGFTTHTTTWLPVNDNCHSPKELNVAWQEAEETSHLHLYKELAQLRQEHTFQRGGLAFPIITDKVFSFIRHLEGYESYLLVINTSEEELEVDLHHDSNFDLPETGVVVLRSTTDHSDHTHPGSHIHLEEVPLVAGEGLLLSFSLDE